MWGAVWAALLCLVGCRGGGAQQVVGERRQQQEGATACPFSQLWNTGSMESEPSRAHLGDHTPRANSTGGNSD